MFFFIFVMSFNHFHYLQTQFFVNLFVLYLTVQAGVDHLPGLRVHVVAVQFVGQRVVSSTSKYIEVAVKGNHGVAITSLRRRRGASE